MANLDMTDHEALRHLLFPRGENMVGFGENEDKFVHFFLQFGVNIKSPPYTAKKSGGDSQFTRFHIFLDKEDDKKVSEVIAGLVKHVEFLLEKSPFGVDVYPILYKVDDKILSRCYAIAKRLQKEVRKGANQEATKSKNKKGNVFADGISRDINFNKMSIKNKLKPILKSRLDEAALCFDNGAYLSAIIMAGSVLEGVLLGYAMQNPEKFNQSKCCPKDKKSGKPCPFNDWSLAQLIDAAKEIGALNDDMKKFGHSLREYRNYIHPHEQLKEGFKASQENAHLCLQALIYALKNLMTK